MKKILVLADIHSGSTVSVMPDEVHVEHKDANKANVIQSNPLQKILWEKWKEMVSEVGRVDACYLLGDLIDGPNIKSRGFELWTSNMHQQVETAHEMLSMVRTSKYFGCQGSMYHVGENTSSDLAVLDALRGTFGTDLVVQVNGHRIHLNHEVAYSGSPMTRATAPYGEIVGAVRYDKWFGDFSLLLRGHLHRFMHIHDTDGRIVLCPGWKVRDAYQAKKGLRGGPSHIGYLVLHVDKENIFVEPHVWVPAREHIFREVIM